MALLTPGASYSAAYAASNAPKAKAKSEKHHTGIFLVLVSASTTPTHLADLVAGKTRVVAALSSGTLLREIARSMGKKRYTASKCCDSYCLLHLG